MLSDLSEERDDGHRLIFVSFWQVDFITEDHEPLGLHDWMHDEAVWSALHFGVVAQRVQQQLRRRRAGEVERHQLKLGQRTKNGGQGHGFSCERKQSNKKKEVRS